MMPEERSLLERTYKMAEENNSILRKMRRANRWSVAFRVFYWVVIIGLGVGAYYALEPIIDSAVSIINDGQNILQDFSPR